MNRESPATIIIIAIVVLFIGFVVLAITNDNSPSSPNLEKEKRIKKSGDSSRFEGKTISFDLNKKIKNIQTSTIGESEVINLDFENQKTRITTWPRAADDSYLDFSRDYGNPQKKVFQKNKWIYLYPKGLLFQTPQSNVSIQTDSPGLLLKLAESASSGAN